MDNCIIHVFQNPLAWLSCFTNHKGIKDRRAAYLEHEELLATTPARDYSTGRYFRELQQMTLHTYSGMRVQFLQNWFSHPHLLNKLLESDHPYGLVRPMLLISVSLDDRLTDAFTELVKTGKNNMDVLNMK